MGGMYLLPSCADSYCVQLCAYLAKAARSGSNCFVQRMQKLKMSEMQASRITK